MGGGIKEGVCQTSHAYCWTAKPEKKECYWVITDQFAEYRQNHSHPIGALHFQESQYHPPVRDTGAMSYPVPSPRVPGKSRPVSVFPVTL